MFGHGSLSKWGVACFHFLGQLLELCLIRQMFGRFYQLPVPRTSERSSFRSYCLCLLVCHYVHLFMHYSLTASNRNFEMPYFCWKVVGRPAGLHWCLVLLLYRITADTLQHFWGLANPRPSYTGTGTSVPKSVTSRHLSCNAETPCHGWEHEPAP